MAYCRFSSMPGGCDAYVYADPHGNWVTILRSHKPQPGAPEVPLSLLVDENNEPCDEGVTRYRAALAKRKAWDETNPPEPINHPLAGETLKHRSPGACADQLADLKAAGLNIPGRVIRDLRADQITFEADDGDDADEDPNHA